MTPMAAAPPGVRPKGGGKAPGIFTLPPGGGITGMVAVPPGTSQKHFAVCLIFLRLILVATPVLKPMINSTKLIEDRFDHVFVYALYFYKHSNF